MGIVLSMSNVSKAYDSTMALKDVCLDVEKGSIHALVGENGAGKSTLMKVLAGVVHCDEGTLSLRGKQLELKNPREALQHGVSTVFQELSLLPNLTIAENMFLGKEPVTRFGRVNRKLMEAQTAEKLSQLEVDLEPDTIVGRLSIAQRQFVEIAHGLAADADVIILDEPTAALNAADVEILNRQIRSLAKQGKSIIYISHRLDEIFEVCDTVSVLKDGQNVTTCAVETLTPQQLIAFMVGRDIKDLYPTKAASFGRQALTVDNLQLTETSTALSLSVAKGEIVGLAGLEGQGQHEIVRSLFGQYQPVKGAATLNGTELRLPLAERDGVRHLQSLGVGFVPEDRKEEGLFLELAISFNIALGLHSRRRDISRARRYREVIADTMARLDIKASSADARVSSLSGGNQQKTLLARYLATKVNILVIEEPTRGVDVGAKAEIYRLLREFADTGGAVLVLSRETVELIGLCDRLYVIHGNTVVSELSAAVATEHKILDAALTR